MRCVRVQHRSQSEALLDRSAVAIATPNVRCGNDGKN